MLSRRFYRTASKLRYMHVGVILVGAYGHCVRNFWKVWVIWNTIPCNNSQISLVNSLVIIVNE